MILHRQARRKEEEEDRNSLARNLETDCEIALLSQTEEG